ncbi:hypothetical protein [Paenibacillus tepidiphilus]|uniref:hypothetical protein n=1 Tax=Paenibacillus tepidiphilus TaxID=2608683 RepID=UPI00123A84F8|nr:hypothetical protein [Paenibacillus tepidiphilus]
MVRTRLGFTFSAVGDDGRYQQLQLTHPMLQTKPGSGPARQTPTAVARAPSAPNEARLPFGAVGDSGRHQQQQFVLPVLWTRLGFTFVAAGTRSPSSLYNLRAADRQPVISTNCFASLQSNA